MVFDADELREYREALPERLVGKFILYRSPGGERKRVDYYQDERLAARGDSQWTGFAIYARGWSERGEAERFAEALGVAGVHIEPFFGAPSQYARRSAELDGKYVVSLPDRFRPSARMYSKDARFREQGTSTWTRNIFKAMCWEDRDAAQSVADKVASKCPPGLVRVEQYTAPQEPSVDEAEAEHARLARALHGKYVVCRRGAELPGGRLCYRDERFISPGGDAWTQSRFDARGWEDLDEARRFTEKLGIEDARVERYICPARLIEELNE